MINMSILGRLMNAVRQTFRHATVYESEYTCKFIEAVLLLIAFEAISILLSSYYAITIVDCLYSMFRTSFANCLMCLEMLFTIFTSLNYTPVTE